MIHASISSFTLTALFTLQFTEVTSRVIPRDLDLTSLSSSLLNGSLLGGPLLNSSVPDGSLLNGSLAGPYSLPQNDPNSVTRSAGIAVKQAGYLYGPPVAGGPYFPTGALGTVRVATDQAAIQLDLGPELAATAVDVADSTASAPQYNGLQTLDDYTLLYDGHFKLTLPNGPDPGVLTNYTQDLLFSMERLSISPYQVRRLNPSSDKLQFTIDDHLAKNITGMTMQQLFREGRLFYADYRDQKNLTPTLQYAAACDAFFYIDRKSGEFLPLAIRTNVGSNLIYTPMDKPNDWLLAKIMYNVNDFWFAQWNHLAQSHEVVQIVYLAAIRTLSSSHPVLAILDRLMYEVYAIQPLALTVLFLPGAAVDQVFPYTGLSAQDYATNRYQNGGAGRFVANYFTSDLASRGLINSTYGPPLKHFPFYEDASTIYAAIHKFMTSFVNSYYRSDADVLADKELQAWVKEAQGPAKVIDFRAIQTKPALVNVLTHIAHLASTAHHTVNTNELLSISSALPFHTAAIYLPPPTSKGVTNVAAYLPKLVKVEESLAVAALFARPFLVGTNRTLLHMFDDQSMLDRMNPTTQQAAATFMSSMQAFSNQVAARTFDQNGLSQGMPFVWQALDPNVAPYSITT